MDGKFKIEKETFPLFFLVWYSTPRSLCLVSSRYSIYQQEVSVSFGCEEDRNDPFLIPSAPDNFTHF